MISKFSFQHFRFHLEPRGTLQMPAYNKGNVIWDGFGSMRGGVRFDSKTQRR